jgi:hypothetical protein
MDRLEKLKELEGILEHALATSDIKSMAAIARQYRETIREIEEIEGATDDGDEIAQILSDVDSDGNARAVR